MYKMLRVLVDVWKCFVVSADDSLPPFPFLPIYFFSSAISTCPSLPSPSSFLFPPLSLLLSHSPSSLTTLSFLILSSFLTFFLTLPLLSFLFPSSLFLLFLSLLLASSFLPPIFLLPSLQPFLLSFFSFLPPTFFYHPPSFLLPSFLLPSSYLPSS